MAITKTKAKTKTPKPDADKRPKSLRESQNKVRSAALFLPAPADWKPSIGDQCFFPPRTRETHEVKDPDTGFVRYKQKFVNVLGAYPLCEVCNTLGGGDLCIIKELNKEHPKRRKVLVSILRPFKGWGIEKYQPDAASSPLADLAKEVSVGVGSDSVDAILKRHKAEYLLSLFRVGDFYELYAADASIGHDILGLTITTRNPGKRNELKMAGFPHHQLEACLRKLVASGHRVAICERTEKVDAKSVSGKVTKKS